MKRVVWIDGARHDLEPAALLGQGGEAEVYDLGDGRVVKWWKPADHPDFDGLPAAQAAATRRLAEAPARLRALPGGLPAAVVAPCGLALGGSRAPKASDVVGFVMARVTGEPLHSYGEPRWRRDHAIDASDVVAALLALHDAIAALHRAGIVIGDCNDLNVLVDGRRVHLIDVDSYQLAGFPCAMFSERFVDPRLCDATGAPILPHDRDSDWFAFAAMVLRSLLGVGPWGGVHAPADPAGRCAPSARAHRRLSVLGADITYPRAARPPAILTAELIDTLRAIFERDQRGVFPRALLGNVRLRPCASCGEAHAHPRCPLCQALAPRPIAITSGNLRYHAIAIADVAPATREITTARDAAIWLEAGALWRTGRLGPDRIGSVLAGQTRAWVGDALGVGFYRAGGFAVGFVFRRDRGALVDSVALPRIRGQLVAAHAAIADDRAWLTLTCADAGRLVTTAIVIAADGRTLATANITDAPWRGGIAGACAIGAHLFVPTDDGIARIEVSAGDLAHTRTFTETAALIGAGDRLARAPAGLDAVRARDAIRLQLT